MTLEETLLTEHLGRACTAVQQLVTTYPGTPVAIVPQRVDPPLWEVRVGRTALAVADRPDNVWAWRDEDTRQRVLRVLDRYRTLEAADARRVR
jgi:hypothetical protein